jgi:hypothetical protein
LNRFHCLPVTYLITFNTVFYPTTARHSKGLEKSTTHSAFVPALSYFPSSVTELRE